MILIELWPTLHTLQKMFNWLVNKYPHFKLNLACSGLLSCRVLLMFWSARETKTSQTLRCARWFTGSFKVFSPCQVWGAGGLLWRKRFNQTLQHQKPHKRMIKTSRTGRKINHQTWGFIYQKKDWIDKKWDSTDSTKSNSNDGLWGDIKRLVWCWFDTQIPRLWSCIQVEGGVTYPFFKQPKKGESFKPLFAHHPSTSELGTLRDCACVALGTGSKRRSPSAVGTWQGWDSIKNGGLVMRKSAN